MQQYRQMANFCRNIDHPNCFVHVPPIFTMYRGQPYPRTYWDIIPPKRKEKI